MTTNTNYFHKTIINNYYNLLDAKQITILDKNPYQQTEHRISASASYNNVTSKLIFLTSLYKKF